MDNDELILFIDCVQTQKCIDCHTKQRREYAVESWRINWKKLCKKCSEKDEAELNEFIEAVTKGSQVRKVG
jgi:hypothetical protein